MPRFKQNSGRVWIGDWRFQGGGHLVRIRTDVWGGSIEVDDRMYLGVRQELWAEERCLARRLRANSRRLTKFEFQGRQYKVRSEGGCLRLLRVVDEDSGRRLAAISRGRWRDTVLCRLGDADTTAFVFWIWLWSCQR
jgi:hypothetical protein